MSDFDYPHGADRELRRREREGDDRRAAVYAAEQRAREDVHIFNRYYGTNLTDADYGILITEGIINEKFTMRIAEYIVDKDRGAV